MDTTANLRAAGLTAPQARELRAVAANGRLTGVTGALRVANKLVELGLVERPGESVGYFYVVATEAGREALRVLDGGDAYLEERGRRQLAAAYAQRCADGTELRWMYRRAGEVELAAELEASGRAATDEELRAFRDGSASRAVAEGKDRTNRGARRALAAWAEVEAIDAILAERTAATAVELEVHPDDDAADLAAPAGERVYLRGTVHLNLDVPEVAEATCGVSTVGGIDTEAPVTCAACLAAYLEAAGVDVAAVDELATDVVEVLNARRQAEAPAPTLPGVDAAIVEAELGGTQDDEGLLFVIPCSGAKLDRPAPAGELYTGSLHRSARLAADALVARHGGRVVILSALHGLTELDEVLKPYDVTVGDLEALTVATLARQMTRRRVRRVVALAPRSYTALLVRAATIADVELVTPLAGSRGVLEQRGRLRRLRTGELELGASSAL